MKGNAPMKTLSTGSAGQFRKIRQNIQALRQVNMTMTQMRYMLKEPVLWFHVTRNFREIEGSWWKALKRYFFMFEGVPDKKKPLKPVV